MGGQPDTVVVAELSNGREAIHEFCKQRSDARRDDRAETRHHRVL